MTAFAIGLSVVLVVLNGAFVAVEFAVLGARRSQLETMAADGNRAAAAGIKLQSEVLETLGGAQLGITVCSLVLGRLGEPAVAKLLEAGLSQFVELSDTVLHTLGFAGALSIVVVIHMVLGEMVPKNLALTGPDRTLLALARPTRAYLRVARPVNGALQVLANLLLRMFRVEPTHELSDAATSAEIGVMVRESHQEGLIDAEERALIEGALRFGETVAAEVMVPIDAVDAVEVGDEVHVIERRLDETDHTRLVVFGAGPRDVRGFVHSKDLIGLPPTSREWELPTSLIRPMLRVAPDTQLPDVLSLMRRAQIHLALVTADDISHGVLTLDDVLRGLVGTLTEPNGDTE